jgi:UDP-N-acetylglucosamine 2-epimerase (non-hydrolysing)
MVMISDNVSNMGKTVKRCLPLKVVVLFGTRPEAIKLSPLVYELRRHPNEFEVSVCVTGQHREMLDQVLDFFQIKPDYDLNLMKQNQTLFDITADGLKSIGSVLDAEHPDLVIVQGDTTTAFVGALAAFYKQIKVAHIEAGLRTYEKYSPFPEEINRVLVSHLADYHFAPTGSAKKNLEREGITENVWVVGNTVIDALFLGLSIIKQEGDQKYYDFFKGIDFTRKIILVTGHRRESFGEPFRNICNAIRQIAEQFPDVEVVYPVHFNPNVRQPVNEILGGHERIHLIEPLPYPYMIWLMGKCYLILTDSGGIQEEAPSLHKPVLVMRDVTEREEGIQAGTAKLLGTSSENIVLQVSNLIQSQEAYTAMSSHINPYGDGNASTQIVGVFERA